MDSSRPTNIFPLHKIRKTYLKYPIVSNFLPVLNLDTITYIK